MVVKADPNLDENSWNEAKSKATPLNIVQEKDSDDYKMIKTFNMSTFTTNPALCVVYKSSDWLLATLSFFVRINLIFDYIL